MSDYKEKIFDITNTKKWIETANKVHQTKNNMIKIYPCTYML